jgi:hypothetical protein
MPKTRKFINDHFEKALQRGYIKYFSVAALKYDFPLALLMAIASRETNMTNMKGDFRKSKHFPSGGYHGYGIMQVDVGTDPAWIVSGAWQKVDQAIMHGTKLLSDKRNQLNNMWSGTRTLKEFLWVLAASYNHGAEGSYNDFKAHGSPDLHTTGHDYGADVLGRMAEFQQLLNDRGITAAQYAMQGANTLAALPSQPPSVTDQGASTFIQVGEENTIDGDSSQPVPGGGSTDPAATLATTGVVKSGGLKATIAALAASVWLAIQTFGIQLGETFQTAKGAFADNPLATISIILGFVSGLVIYWKYMDRQTQLDKQREQQAHERDLANLAVLSDPKKINVQVKPPVPANQQPTQ